MPVILFFSLQMVLELLQDILLNNHLIAAEHKAAVAIIKQLETNEIDEKQEQLHALLNPNPVFCSIQLLVSFFIILIPFDLDDKCNI